MSNKPVIAPMASILSDDKSVLAVIGLLLVSLVQLVPSIPPAAVPVLTALIFIPFAFLVLHQGIEDIIAALADYYAAKNGVLARAGRKELTANDYAASRAPAQQPAGTSG
jgi:hypothetical protein